MTTHSNLFLLHVNWVNWSVTLEDTIESQLIFTSCQFLLNQNLSHFRLVAWLQVLTHERIEQFVLELLSQPSEVVRPLANTDSARSLFLIEIGTSRSVLWCRCSQFEVDVLMGVASLLGCCLPADVSTWLGGRGSCPLVLQAQHQRAGRPCNGHGFLGRLFVPQRVARLHRVSNLFVAMHLCQLCTLSVCHWCNLSFVSIICVYCVNCVNCLNCSKL